MNIDLEIGDIILTGKWRNKKEEVKKIGEDSKGQPTINGTQILKFRIQKLLPDKDKPKEIKEESILFKGMDRR